MKKLVRLTEHDLHKIISRSVKRILKENTINEISPEVAAAYANGRRLQAYGKLPLSKAKERQLNKRMSPILGKESNFFNLSDDADDGQHAAIDRWNKDFGIKDSTDDVYSRTTMSPYGMDNYMISKSKKNKSHAKDGHHDFDVDYYFPQDDTSYNKKSTYSDSLGTPINPNERFIADRYNGENVSDDGTFTQTIYDEPSSSNNYTSGLRTFTQTPRKQATQRPNGADVAQRMSKAKWSDVQQRLKNRK